MSWRFLIDIRKSEDGKNSEEDSSSIILTMIDHLDHIHHVPHYVDHVLHHADNFQGL